MTSTIRSLESVVSWYSRYAIGWINYSSNPDTGKRLSLLLNITLAQGPTQPPIQRVPPFLTGVSVARVCCEALNST